MQVQILPFEAGAHAGLMGSFNLLRFEDDPDLVYTEDFVQGHMTANPQAAQGGFAPLRSLAGRRPLRGGFGGTDRPRNGGALWGPART